jgi:agarase
MLEWNFNTIAYGDQYIIATGLPYCIKLAMAGGNWITGEIPDYFSQEWEDYADNHAKEYLLPRLDDTNLIGYFLDNELHWGPDWRTLNDLITDYCSLPADSPGKQELVQFFKLRYRDNINEFNLAWLTSFKNFDEILHASGIGLPITPKATSDRNAFAGLVAEQYFKTCHEKIRKYDKNHLILGARFQSYLTPLEVVKACVPYVDVVSVNHYFSNPVLYGPLKILEELMDFTCPLDVLQEYYDLTGKPILISEFNIRAKDSGLPNTSPSPILFPVVNTQWQRADWFEYHMTRFINKPYSVGYHWFSYNDEPATGRSDGEDSNTGIVSIEDRPYQPLVEKMTKVNKLAQESVKKSKTINQPIPIIQNQQKSFFQISKIITFYTLLTKLLTFQ